MALRGEWSTNQIIRAENHSSYIPGTAGWTLLRHICVISKWFPVAQNWVPYTACVYITSLNQFNYLFFYDSNLKGTVVLSNLIIKNSER